MIDTHDMVIYFEKDLVEAANRAVKGSPLNQTEIGSLLGVTRQAVSKALTDPAENLTRLRLRIVEVLGKKRLVGPVYIWKKPSEVPDDANTV